MVSTTVDSKFITQVIPCKPTTFTNCGYQIGRFEDCEKWDHDPESGSAYSGGSGKFASM
jgi:hypothetical protein